MTSLAAQLQRLSVPYTQSVWAPDKRRASLLFDPKEAANLDRQAVYAIGISGLEELEGLDPVFMEYASTLFNPSSQTWERALQSGEVNQRLDQTLEQFLVQLSPYFLLKCAHKALEWLIYRYHIHQMNIDALLRCVFPYHETKIFVRVVQLLPIEKETHQWNWIHASGKTGAPLTRAVIVNHCRSDPAFLTFLCDLVPTFVSVLGAGSPGVRAAVGLWTCSVLGVTEDRAHVTERIMAVLVPALVRALKSRCDDLKAASYMVVAQLASHSSLQADFVRTMLQVLTKHFSPKLTREALMCLALVCKTQKLEDLPKKCFKRICRIPALVPLLAVLADKYDVTDFLRLFLHRLLPVAIKATSSVTSSSAASDDELGQSGSLQYDGLLHGVLSEVTMDTNMATEMATKLLQELVAVKASMRPEEEWKPAAQSYLSMFQSRYAVSMDLAVESLTAAKKKKSERAALQTILQAAMGGAKGRMIDSSTSLLLALNHAHGTTRALAVRHLADMVQEEGQETSGDDVADLLLQRLTDDHKGVIKTVLSMKVLFKVLHTLEHRQKLKEHILDLMVKRHNKGGWSDILNQAASVLCSAEMEEARGSELGLRLVPYLLLSTTEDTHLAMPLTVLRSGVAANDPILKTFHKKWLAEAEKSSDGKTDKATTLNHLVLIGCSEAVSKDPSLVQHLGELGLEDGRFCLVALCAFSRALTDLDPGRKVAEAMVASVLQMLALHMPSLRKRTTFTTESNDMTSYLARWVRDLDRDDVTISPSALWWAFKALVNRKHDLPDSPWWTLDDFEVNEVAQTLDMLVQVSCHQGNSNQGEPSPWQQLVRTLTHEVLNGSSLARLASLLWGLHVSPASTHNAPVSPMIQVAASHVLARTWQNASEEELVNLLESKTSPVLPSLLVCLGSPEEALRSGALCCLKTARKVSKDLGRCTPLIKKICKQKEEVTADPTHVQNILRKVLKEDADLCDLVTHHVIDSQTPPPIRERLLYHLRATPNECVLERLMDVGREVLTRCRDGAVTSLHVEMLRHLVARVGVEDAREMAVESGSWTLVLTALRTPQKVPGLDQPAAIVMAQVSRELFKALPSNAERGQMVSAILDVGETAASPDLANQAHRLLQQLRLEWDEIQHEVSRDDTPSTPKTVRNRRKSRLLAVDTTLSWKRMTFLLESLQQRKSMSDSEPCVAALFKLLTKLQSHEGEEWEYRQRLVLSLIHNLTDKWQQQQLAPKQESVNIEVLVQVVRNPRANTQTKQHALGVMANLAFYFPEHLLHHVMSIFTFVGTGLLAADDEHSLRVVSRTITTIVPALLGARSNTSKDTDHLITQIVQVFVDAQRSIPRHRAQAVFTTLISTLGPETALWRVLTLIVTNATQHRDTESPATQHELPPDTVSGSMEQDLEFGLSICEQFEVATMVETATQLVRFLQWLAEQHDQGQGQTKGGRQRKRSQSGMLSLVDVDTLTGHQRRLLQYHVTRLLTRLLSTQTLVTQVVQTGDVAGTTFHRFVKEAVVYLLAVARTHNNVAATPHAKFWKAIMGKAYEVIDKVLYLLPTRVLLEVVSGLLNLDLHGVRRKALELLASKLQALLVTPPTDDQCAPLLEIVETLLTISMATCNVQDADVTATQQMALFNLKLLCKVLGEKNQACFVNVLKKVMSRVAADQPAAVVGSVLLVEAEVVSVVRAHAIPHLPQLLNPLLELLANKDFIAEHELVLTCGLTALHRLVVTLPHFLSPYLRQLLTVVCQLNTQTDESDKKSQSTLRLAAIRHQVAKVIAPRVLVPALGNTFSEVLSSEHVSQMSLTSVMSIAKDHVTSLSREDLSAQHTPLLDFFCTALDLRSLNTKLSRAMVTGVEESVIEAILAMVVRLSEASFRPMFYKLYDWGCREETEQSRLRKLTFFRLADSLAGKLRSLFNLFIGQTLQAASGILVDNNSLTGPVTYFGADDESTTLSCELLGHVLDCLTKCMTYDTEGVFSGDIFNLLLQPLVDQVENFVGSDADYEERMRAHVVPCLSHFMVATKEDSHQKALNYQVLLKARHVSPKVRFTALRVISGAATQMGDDYVLLLPETIPFLAELMEDECEEVERECQLVIANLETVLGESLQKYF